MFSET